MQVKKILIIQNLCHKLIYTCIHTYVYGEKNILLVLVPRVDSDK